MKPMRDLLYHTVSARTSLLREAFFRRPDPIRLLLDWSMLGIGLGTLLYSAKPEGHSEMCSGRRSVPC